MFMYKFGPVQKKILITLLGGIALGMSSSPRQYFRTLNEIQKEWGKLRKDSVKRSLGRLSKEKLIVKKRLPDGSIGFILSKEGECQAKAIRLVNEFRKIKRSKKWDKKWRIVIFDIPEKDRIFREILRKHLRSLGFMRLQNSVFVSIYPSERLIINLARLYSAESYVRVITASYIDNEKKLKKIFDVCKST